MGKLFVDKTNIAKDHKLSVPDFTRLAACMLRDAYQEGHYPTLADAMASLSLVAFLLHAEKVKREDFLVIAGQAFDAVAEGPPHSKSKA